MVGKEVNHEKTYPYAGYEVCTCKPKILLTNCQIIHLSHSRKIKTGFVKHNPIGIQVPRLMKLLKSRNKVATKMKLK